MQHSNVGLQVAMRCKCKLYCSERKRGVMECLDMPGEPPQCIHRSPDKCVRER